MRSEKDKPEKFNFEKMKIAATHADPAVRKRIFIEYFERFAEFPSYLFDNETNIDARLYKTMQDLLKDPKTPKAMRDGVDAVIVRLPPPDANA